MVLSFYLILLPQFTNIPSASTSDPSVSPSLSVSVANRAPANSRPYFYLHLLDTCISGCCTASSHRSRIRHIVMNFMNVL